MKYKKSIALLVFILGITLIPCLALAHNDGDGGHGDSHGAGASEPEGFMGGGQTPSRSNVADTLDAVKSTNSLENMAREISRKADNGDGALEKDSDELQNLLKKINEQADQIEAEVADLKKRYRSPLVHAKIDKLKAYVEIIRAEATQQVEGKI